MKAISLKTIKNKKPQARQEHPTATSIRKNPIGTINVSSTNVSTFDELYLNATIHTIIARNTQISTLIGAKVLPKIISLDVTGSPLSKEPLLDFMASMAFGPSLYRVNGQAISMATKNLVRQYSARLRPILNEGYVIKTIRPEIKVQKVGHPELYIFDYTTETLKEFFSKEQQIRENDLEINELLQEVEKLTKEGKTEIKTYKIPVKLFPKHEN